MIRLLKKVNNRSEKKRKLLNDLLEQKYIDLVTTYDRLILNAKTRERFAEHLEKIEAIFQAEHNWDNASTIEQMLAPMYNEVELDIEIRVNLLEASRRLSPEGKQFFDNEYDLLQKSEENEDLANAKLNLLCNLYKKLQISYDLEEQKKYMLSSIRLSTSVVFFCSILMFFLFANVQLLNKIPGLMPADKTDFIIAAIFSGWMGACFSMLLRMRGDIKHQSLSELAAINRLDNLVSRSLIGMVSGLLIFYSFEGQFLQGSLFPLVNFDTQGVYQSPDPNWIKAKAHAMIIFWGFLAGFSEKMVPDLLSKAEQKKAENSS